MAIEQQTIITELKADVDKYKEDLASSNEALKKLAEGIEEVVDGQDKLKSAGDKALGVLEGFGPKGLAAAEAIKKIPDPAIRAAKALEEVQRQQAALSKGGTGLDKLNGLMGRAQGELGKLTAALGPVGLGVGAVTTAVLGGAAAFGAYALSAGKAYLETTGEGKKQVETLSTAHNQLNRAVGQTVSEVLNLGPAMDGVSVLVSRASEKIRTLREDTAAWHTEIGGLAHVLTGGLSTALIGTTGGLSELGKEAQAAREQFNIFNKDLEKNIKLLKDYEDKQKEVGGEAKGKLEGEVKKLEQRLSAAASAAKARRDAAKKSVEALGERERESRLGADLAVSGEIARPAQELERQRKERVEAQEREQRRRADERRRQIEEQFKAADKTADLYRQTGQIADPALKTTIDRTQELSKALNVTRDAALGLFTTMSAGLADVDAGGGAFERLAQASGQATAQSLEWAAQAAEARAALLFFEAPWAAVGYGVAAAGARLAAGRIAQESGGGAGRGGGGRPAAPAAGRTSSGGIPGASLSGVTQTQEPTTRNLNVTVRIDARDAASAMASANNELIEQGYYRALPHRLISQGRW